MSDSDDNQSTDAFQKIPHAPHLQEWRELAEPAPSPSKLTLFLQKQLADVIDKQDFYNELRRFKRSRLEECDVLESDPFQHRRQIEIHHTETAEAITHVTLQRTFDDLVRDFGPPAFLNSFSQISPAGLGTIAMGRFGAGEMGAYSDLDLVFVYSNIGETRGQKRITNGEFFSKLVQRFINALSLVTEAGKCYEVDMELRPSGRSGTLVVSYERFLDHQMNEVQSWERMAWLKSRLTSVLGEFPSPLSKQIQKLTYDRPIPDAFFNDMAAIRQQVIHEKCKENDNQIDLKLGRGGIMDLEFILLGVQLKSQILFPDLRVRGSYNLIQQLKSHTLLPPEDLTLIESGWSLARAVEAGWQRLKKRDEKTLNFEDADFNNLAQNLSRNSEDLKAELLMTRQNIAKLYGSFYGNT